MTSQIALMNQLGIAVASDTLTSRHESSGDTKTYPASSKLYEVSPAHKVVIAHCGTTKLASSHYRMLLSEWALTLPEPLAHVEDYAKSFISWVEANAASLYFDEEQLVGYSLQREFGKLLALDAQNFGQLVGTYLSSEGKADLAAFETELSKLLTAVTSARYTMDPYEDLNKTSTKALLKELKVSPLDIFKSVLLDEGQNIEFSKDFGKFIDDISEQFLMRFVDGSEGADLNFVGFGSAERLGHCVQVSIDSFYGKKLRYKVSVSGSDNPNWYPSWNVFAQGEAILKFLRGLDGNLQDMIAGTVYATLSKEITDEKKSDSMMEEILSVLDTRLQESYVNPMMLTMGALGVGGLTRLADMLVRMEALRSASLEGEATVGGYVESLSITREAGVVWHRRMSVDQHSLEDSSHVFA